MFGLLRQRFWHLTTLLYWCSLARMNEFSKNANYALVVGETTASYGPDKRKQWEEFLANVRQNVRPAKNTTMIHDNIWLIHLATDMLFLSELFQWSRNQNIRLHILFLDDEPDWIKYPPDAQAPQSGTESRTEL